MGLPNGANLTPLEAEQLIARLRAICSYIAATIGDNPTPHDMRLAREHARACRDCAVAVADYYDGDNGGTA
jgi:hypothetical protein